MPVLNSILDHQVLGPAILQGRREGLQEGLQEGRQEIVKKLLEKQFGPLPSWIEDQLKSSSSSELDTIAIRLLDAKRLEDLFPR
jgi:flagellar biosynthesis/type III secretory pathway protein FliH